MSINQKEWIDFCEGYKGYGLSSAQLNFDLAKLPKDLSAPTHDKHGIQLKKDKLLLKCSDCRLQISNGHEIRLDFKKNFNTCCDWIRGFATGISLMQRGQLVLHANSFVSNNQLIALTGDTGAGKSSLAMAFHQSGALFHADELVVFQKESHISLPGFPFLRLWPEELEKHTIDTSICNILWDEEKKYAYSTSTQRSTDSLAIDFLIHISESADIESCELKEVKGIEKLKVFLKSLYRPELLETIDPKQNHLQQAVNIIKTMRIFQLTRPLGQDSLKDAERLITHLIKWTEDFFELAVSRLR